MKAVAIAKADRTARHRIPLYRQARSSSSPVAGHILFPATLLGTGYEISSKGQSLQLEQLGVLGHFGGGKLQGHVPAERRGLGFVNHAHSPRMNPSSHIAPVGTT